jgi:hypothetical protein
VVDAKEEARLTPPRRWSWMLNLTSLFFSMVWRIYASLDLNVKYCGNQNLAYLESFCCHLSNGVVSRSFIPSLRSSKTHFGTAVIAYQ